MRADLVDRVEGVLSGVVLLLVFVLALFDLSYPRLRDALDEELPAADRPVERRRYGRRFAGRCSPPLSHRRSSMPSLPTRWRLLRKMSWRTAT
jgi:hypothetical protein